MPNKNKNTTMPQFVQTSVMQSVLLPTELRLGNLIFSKETQEIETITTISEEYITFNSITFDYPVIEEIEPILITEEWLLWFGFKNENYGWDIKEFGLFDHNYKNGKSLRLALNASPVPVTRIKYVHQLQNLYFSLTGRELTVA